MSFIHLYLALNLALFFEREQIDKYLIKRASLIIVDSSYKTLDSWNIFNCYLNRCACSTFHTLLHHHPFFFLSTLLLYFISVVKKISVRFKIKIKYSHEFFLPIKLSTLSFSLELPLPHQCANFIMINDDGEDRNSSIFVNLCSIQSS